MVATASGSSIGAAFAAAVGTGISFFGSGLGIAVLAMIAAFVVVSLIHAYHPPAVALASIPILLHPGHRFALVAVLPFTAAVVGSAAAMSKCPWLARVSQVVTRLRAINSARAIHMCAQERGHSLTVTRRRFVQGIAVAGLAALIEGKFN